MILAIEKVIWATNKVIPAAVKVILVNERATFSLTITNKVNSATEKSDIDHYTPSNIGSLEGPLQYNHHETPGAGFSWGYMMIVLKGSF